MSINTRSGYLDEIRWSIPISKSLRILCVSFSRTDYDLSVYHLVLWSNFNFLHNFQWVTFTTQSCQILNTFGVSLLESLAVWFIALSLSQYNLHLLFCGTILILASIKLVLMALFCAAIRRHSYSLLRSSFLCHVRVFSRKISLVCRLKYPYSCFYFHLVTYLLLFCLSLCCQSYFWSL